MSAKEARLVPKHFEEFFLATYGRAEAMSTLN